MGEKQNQPLRLSFNPSLRVDFQGSWVTSDGGLVLVRELDERLGLWSMSGAMGSAEAAPLQRYPTLCDELAGRNTSWPLGAQRIG